MQTVLPQLIVGLGNPGPEYEDTRHNVGFAVVDGLLARLKGGVLQEHRYGAVLNIARIGGRRVWLLKPTTFMNCSGNAVGKASRVLELFPREILVCHDCLDLPLGRIRLRQKGTSGGHKGIESIIEALGSSQFPRLRVGIGRPAGPTVGFVLSRWEPDEVPVIQQAVSASCDALLVAMTRGTDVAMNQFNAWQPETSPDPTGKGRGEQN